MSTSHFSQQRGKRNHHRHHIDPAGEDSRMLTTHCELPCGLRLKIRNSRYRVCEKVSKTAEKKAVDGWRSAGRDRNNFTVVKGIF